MAKRGNRPQANPRRATESLESTSTPLVELSVDYDERPQNVPLEGPTGRMIATMPTGDAESLSRAVAAVSRDFSFNEIISSSDSDDAMDREEMDSAQVIVFEEFRIAVFKSDPDQRARVINAAQSQGMIVEPEYWNHPLGMVSQSVTSLNLDGTAPLGRTSVSLDYFRGFRDGLTRMIEAFEVPSEANGGVISAANFSDSATATWGLQATGVVGAARSGAGVRVAVLDSGFDINHPDFAGRPIISKSFIPPTTTDLGGNVITLTDRSEIIDKSGHGTHCIGTACGPRNPQNGPRYGIAHGAEIFNGKVLSVIPGSPVASGADAWILEGIRWAINNGCSIISMSFGSRVRPGDPISTAYETLASQGWENGILFVAAAGNDSDRDGRYQPLFTRFIRPVARPANCPHIISVAALEPATFESGILKIANFSNRHLIDQGGEVNLSGPGVSVLSSYTQPRHQFLDGTSQATPHVAGIAALVQEETGKKGKDLYLELRNRAVPQQSRLDYGNGLVHV